ncbi:MAG TPA: ABC transporter substrate-binding protein [Burkholderiales bacterium]|nr:ABC transporter substrate-binding protein [Burkholderiales bacterium]
MAISRIAAALGVAATLAAGAAFAQGKVLTVVPHSNLAILDPIWTTAYMSRNHGYMIYDTLFGTDENDKIQPQMVDSWKISADKKVYDFKLRDGLLFHDGAPVTGEDVVASLARWAKRDPMGGALLTFVDKMEATGKDGFRITLKDPAGFVLEALGKPSSNVPFIMPKRIAETPPTEQIKEYIGSGPYVFVKDEFKPGDKAVYVKFDKYKPRKEKPSGTAGGKHVYVDKVVWNLALRDYQAQVNALQKGEVDIIENEPFQHYQTLVKDPNVEVRKPKIGLQYMCRFNHLHPPFNNVKVRQAALASFRQEPFLQAQVGVKELYKPCPSMFTCGTTYGVPTGSDIQSKSNMKKAQELLKASGYDGTPVVIMKPTDLSSIDKLPEVAAQLMRQAGFKVDLQAMDWQTLVSRRAKKDPPKDGGWNMFCTAWVAPDIGNPVNNAALPARGASTPWFGWPEDAKLEELRTAFMRETDEKKKVALAGEVQKRAFEVATHAPLGEYTQPQAGRKGIKGWMTHGLTHQYWNISK